MWLLWYGWLNAMKSIANFGTDSIVWETKILHMICIDLKKKKNNNDDATIDNHKLLSNVSMS